MHAMQQCVFIGYVVVETGQHVGWIVHLVTHEAWHLIPVEIQKIGDGTALLHKKLRAIKSQQERRRLAPPGDIRIQMRAGEIFLAGHSVLCGR